MHEMLCFAGQNVSRKMDGEACPADGCGTRSWPDHGQIGPAVEWRRVEKSRENLRKAGRSWEKLR